jgi:hypothetical protein
LAGTALAVVGLIVNLGTSGSITAAEDKIDVTYNQASQILATPTGGPGFTCTAQIVSTTELRITLGEVAEGDICNIGNFQVKNNGPADARLNGFRLTSADFAGGEIVATVNACGATAPAGGQVDVGFRITIGDVSSGQSFNFNPAQDGLEWRAAPHYVAAECNETP